MLTNHTSQLGPPTRVADTNRAPPRPRHLIAKSLKGLIWIALFAQLFPSSNASATRTAATKKHHDKPQQYLAGGTRWLDSRHDEVVHFICQGGPVYNISLDSRSLRAARIPTADHPRFLGALKAAVSDWAELMGCNRFRVELDMPYPNTRVHFVPIDAPGTLATATRAGDITLNVKRDWFPGSKRHGNYGPKHRLVSFYWVVAHELGHVWGLAHSDRPDALMYPSQCRTCRWSSFEQAAGNVIRASSQTPDWSRPHYANRFFAKTPRTVVGRLLKGDLPSEAALADAAGSCELQTCASDPTTPDAPVQDGCGAPEVTGEAALMGWQLFRQPFALADRRTPQMQHQRTRAPRLPHHRGKHYPLHLLFGPRAAVLAPYDPGRQWWLLNRRAADVPSG